MGRYGPPKCRPNACRLGVASDICPGFVGTCPHERCCSGDQPGHRKKCTGFGQPVGAYVRLCGVGQEKAMGEPILRAVQHDCGQHAAGLQRDTGQYRPGPDQGQAEGDQCKGRADRAQGCDIRRQQDQRPVPGGPDQPADQRDPRKAARTRKLGDQRTTPVGPGPGQKRCRRIGAACRAGSWPSIMVSPMPWRCPWWTDRSLSTIHRAAHRPHRARA